MSFLHTQSCACAKSELDLFSIPPTQTNIENGQWVHYKPISSLSDDAPIESAVPDIGEEYIGISHTLLYVAVSIVRGKDKEAPVGPVNSWLHSLFNQVEIFSNQKLVTPPSHTCPYRAYIEILLNYGPAATTSYLTTALWYDYTAGQMDNCLQNKGAEHCRSFTDGGKIVELIGHLHCDIFNKAIFLINGVEMRLKLVRTRSGI